MQIRPYSAVFSPYSDLGYVQALCLVTQHWHIKRRHTRQIRREKRLLDSCLPGWVTLLRDPLRGAQPWVTSLPQSGRIDFKHKTCTTPHPSFSSLFCCSPELHGGSLKTIPAVTTSWIRSVYPLAATYLYLLSTSEVKYKQVNRCTPHHWSSLSLPTTLSLSFVSSRAAAIDYFSDVTIIVTINQVIG